MKWRIYFQMLLVAVAALCFATACSDDDDPVTDPDNPNPSTGSVTLTVSVSDVAETSAKMTVQSSDATVHYRYGSVLKSELDAAGDSAFASALIAQVAEDAASKNVSVEEYVTSALSSGSRTYALSSLVSDTEYYAYALAVNTDGSAASSLAKAAFTTPAVVIVPAFTLTVTGDASSNSVPFTLAANDEDMYYMLDTVSGDSNSESDFATLVSNFYASMYQMYGGQYSMEFLVDYFSSQGSMESRFSGLAPGSTYRLAVAGVGVDGQVCTDVFFSDSFTTASVPGDMFTIDILEVTATTVSLSIVPANESIQYAVLVSEASVLANYASPQDFFATAVTYGASDWEILSGSKKGTLGGLDPCTEYIIWAVGLDSNAEMSTLGTYESVTTTEGVSSPEYEAWLGTWSVTSASSMMTESPKTFEITIAEQVPGISYYLSGWTVADGNNADDQMGQLLKTYPVTAKFDDQTYHFVVEANESLGQSRDGYYIFYIATGYLQAAQEYAYVPLDWEDVIALDGTIIDGNTAKVEGGVEPVSYSDAYGNTVDDDLVVLSIDFLGSQDGNSWYYMSVADEYVYAYNGSYYIDAPVGPYTLTKKAASASAGRKAASTQLPVKTVKEGVFNSGMRTIDRSEVNSLAVEKSDVSTMYFEGTKSLLRPIVGTRQVQRK